MIEQGLVALIQGGLGSPPEVNAPGGFFAQLPKDQISADAPMAWTYRSVVSEPSYKLAGQDSWTEWQVQIDCHGYRAADAISLARAIDRVLRGGFRGTLSDPDSTYVFGISRLGTFIDGFNDENRSYVRSLEYLVQYSQQ